MDANITESPTKMLFTMPFVTLLFAADLVILYIQFKRTLTQAAKQ